MAEVFPFTVPAWEIAIRATAVYFALVLLVRVVPKRNAGHISPNDMLVLILVGAMGADAALGGTRSVGDIMPMVALVLVGVCAGVPVSCSPPAAAHESTPLIDDGRLLRRNMRREMFTEDELMAVLRRQGIDDLSAVHPACMEADGEISVIGRKG